MIDDRIALRLGALRLARRRGRTRDAAWAASRLRLPGVTLEPGDERFAREMRVKFGRALRVARIRGPRSAAANVTMPLLAAEPHSRRRQLIAALMAAALLLGAIFLYFRFHEPTGDPEGAQPAQQAVVATPPPPLRGRTQPGVAAPVAVVEVTPAPTDAPAAPPATAAPAGGGTGVGGSGGGTGTGNGQGTPVPTVKPTPTPTPAPTVDPSTLMHVRGRVVDAVTRRGIPNVCVGIGVVTCAGAPVTDAQGFYAVDLQIGRVLNWGISFITPGYTTQTIRIPSRAGTVTVPDIRLRVAF